MWCTEDLVLPVHACRRARWLRMDMFRVDGSKVSIPSFLVAPGQVVTISEKALRIPGMQDKIDNPVNIPGWIEKNGPGGRVLREPERAEIDQDINETAIVEFTPDRQYWVVPCLETPNNFGVFLTLFSNYERLIYQIRMEVLAQCLISETANLNLNESFCLMCNQRYKIAPAIKARGLFCSQITRWIYID
jgi:hypothetical protein